MLDVIESFNILKGIPMAKFLAVTKVEDLSKFGFPCFLKADVVGHKSEMGAVVLCYNIEDAKDKLRKMHLKFPKNKIIVQENFEGIEMIVGMKSDDVFGKLLVVGFGGIFAEVKKNVSFRALPVARQDIIEMINDLSGTEVFRARGKKYNIEKFVTLIEKVVHLSDKINVKELDLNPVIVGEKVSKIVDARVELD